MKTVSRLAVSLSLLAGASFATTANAAEYYNCANATGCILVDDAKPRNNKTATQYPMVMAHGLAGWTKLFGLVDYWFGIPEALMKGGSDVYTTKTSSLNDTEVRGEQLLQQVQTITALTGKEKVNLWGHSHGGIDARYVAAVAPEKVASVTAVSSPEQGSKMADWVIKTVTEGSLKDGYTAVDGDYNPATLAVIGFFDFIGGFMDVGSGLTIDQLQEQDSYAALNSLTTEYAQNFNQKYPAAMPSEYCGQPPANNVVDGVAYYSWSGIGGVYNIMDPTDYVMASTAISFGDDPNDGLVSQCSSRLGYVIRDDYKMNHLDSVNQLLGLTAWGRANPVSIYRTQAIRLKQEGL